MKKHFTILNLIAIIVIMFSTNSLYSQELVVHASKPDGSPNFINEVVTANPGISTFRLVTRDTCYLFSGTITLDRDVTFVGELDPTTKRPPTIQPFELPDGSVTGRLFNFVGAGTTVSISDLYLLSKSNNNSENLPDAIGIIVGADSINLHLNNVVFDGWVQFAIGYSGNMDNFYIENCNFRNMVHPSQWYVGEVIRNLWPGTVITDTLSMKNNTMYCVNGYAAAPVTKYLMNYFEFEHNTVLYTFKNPFFIFNVTDAKINNNIFFSNWSGGSSEAEMPWWDQLWSPEVGSIIDLDTLDLAKDSVFAPDLIGDPDLRMKAEARRNVEVKNNAYFWPTTVTDMWTNWNAASPDSLDIYTHNWMNTRTTGMFTDNTTWPGILESGNVNADPLYPQAVYDIVTQATNGLKDWFELCRSNNLSTTVWGQGITVPAGSPTWVPTWPLPEDLKYTNSALLTAGTDGLPLGDLNWFPNLVGVEDEEIVPTRFELKNAYPNPFNPSTNISFTIAQSGNVNLRIYDIMGREVRTVVNNEFRTPGTYNYKVDMNGMASGIYFYTIRHNSNVQTKKMMLLK